MTLKTPRFLPLQYIALCLKTAVNALQGLQGVSLLFCNVSGVFLLLPLPLPLSARKNFYAGVGGMFREHDPNPQLLSRGLIKLHNYFYF